MVEELKLEADDSDDDIIFDGESKAMQISQVRTLNEDSSIAAPNDGSTNAPGPQSDLILACDECYEIFTNKFALHQHMIKVHPKIVSKDPSRYDHILVPTRKIDNVRVVCNICSGVIYDEENGKMHGPTLNFEIGQGSTIKF